MGLFRRKHGMLSTMASVVDVPKGEREQGMDLLQEAEAVFVQIRAPSRLGTALVTLALDGLGVDEDHPQYAPALGQR